MNHHTRYAMLTALLAMAVVFGGSGAASAASAVSQPTHYVAFVTDGGVCVKPIDDLDGACLPEAKVPFFRWLAGKILILIGTWMTGEGIAANGSGSGETGSGDEEGGVPGISGCENALAGLPCSGGHRVESDGVVVDIYYDADGETNAGFRYGASQTIPFPGGDVLCVIPGPPCDPVFWGAGFDFFL